MKKIAYITSYYVNNYGTVLQAFATQEVLGMLGVDAELIRVDGFWGEISRKRKRFFLAQAFRSTMLLYKYGLVISRLICRIGLGKYARHVRIRNKAFERFRTDHLRFSPEYQSIRELHDGLMERYEAVIVGSDQLWLPSNIVGDFFTLSFVPDDVKKISYATSFGQTSLPIEIRKKAGLFLKRIDFLSVREKSGQELIKQIAGRHAKLVLDPVLLPGNDFWVRCAEKERRMIDGDYIFCYFSGKRREERAFSKKLRNALNVPIVNLPCLDEYIWGDDRYSDKQLYDVSPFGVLNLIRNAGFVLTDSFHCTAFSIIFHKRFFTFHRYKERTIYSTNDRLDNILELTGLGDRLMTGDHLSKDYYADIDYSKVDSLLETARRESLDFLDSSIMALKGEK